MTTTLIDTMIRAPKTNPASADTRQRLVDAAALLFANKGFEHVTVREICKASNANVAAVNYHFGDKAGLYRAVVTMAIEQMLETNELSQRAGDGLSPEEQIRGFVRVIRASNQRSGFDVDESEVERDRFELAELVWMVVPNH